MKQEYTNYNPVASRDAIIQGKDYRFTILTSRLIRAEYNAEGHFNDDQTQVVLNREFDVPSFDIFESEDSIEIVTEHVSVKYNKQKFSKEGLRFKLRGNFSAYHSDWHYGALIHDLGGTAETLDQVDGETELERGVLSRFGFSVLDDSTSVNLTEDGWYHASKEERVDFYYFGYGHDYLTALKDYYRLTGNQPLLPRYALGNWWSRYYKYTEASYKTLINRFESDNIPFSVAVMDMDWHKVDIPSKYGSGWTGYSWNTDFFPDPTAFLSWLHEKNMKVTLNVHPAEGVRPHEDMYEEMGKALNIATDKEQFIEFNASDPKFMQAYFDYIHHPMEEQGVDFWWIDWQQGNVTNGADPLWVLNHYHYHDIQKENALGITFSRYAGPGSHRYPIGFSGDTIVSWKSLDFQPYFTATASNIGYGWWSHDIGGHMMGYRDDELTLRWIQLGVLSPIMRLHSSASPFLGKEPWRYQEPYASLMKEYLRFRHQLIPYLFTMNYRASQDLIPLVQPLYYWHPEESAAYDIKNEYYFGSEMLVMPMTQPKDTASQRTRFDGWLPEGNWYDFYSGVKYVGNRRLSIYRTIDQIGLFVKEGTIIPLASLETVSNSTDNPAAFDLMIFVGDDATFNLIEENAQRDVLTSVFNYTEQTGELDIALNREMETTFTIKVIGDARSMQEEALTITMAPNEKRIIQLRTQQGDVTSIQSHLIKTLIFNYLESAYIEYNTKELIWDTVNESQGQLALLRQLQALHLDDNVMGPILELVMSHDSV